MSAIEARDRLAALIPQADVSRTSLPLLRIEAVKIIAASDTATALADDLTAGRAAIEAVGRARLLADEWSDATVKGECPDGDCGACTQGNLATLLLAALDGAAPEPVDGG